MKHVRSFIFILMAFITLMSSKPSQAAVGAMVGSPVVVTAGILVAGGGVTAAVVDLTTPGQWTGIFALFVGLPLLLLGVLILDGEQSLSFAPLSAEDAKKLGVTSSERKSFNAEIDQINALASHVDAELTEMKSEDPAVAGALWTEVKEMITPESFSALVKVSKNLHNVK